MHCRIIIFLNQLFNLNLNFKWAYENHILPTRILSSFSNFRCDSVHSLLKVCLKADRDDRWSPAHVQSTAVTKGPGLCAFCSCWCCKMHTLLSITWGDGGNLPAAAAEEYTRAKIFQVHFVQRTVVSYSQINHQKDFMRITRNLRAGANYHHPKSFAPYNYFLHMFSYMNKFAKTDLCCLIRPATRGYDKSKNFLFAGLFGWVFFGFVFGLTCFFCC